MSPKLVRIFTGVCTIIVIITGKWVLFYERVYTILELFNMINEKGSLLLLLESASGISAEVIQSDVIYTNWALARVLLYIPLLIIICIVLRILVGLAGKSTKFFSVIIYGGLLVHIFAIGNFGLFPLQPSMFVCAGILTLEGLLCIFLEQRQEIHKKAKEIKEREKREKEERKRRLLFPGSYPFEFYSVIWKNFKYNWKNYVVFGLCGGIIVSFLFAVIGMYMLLKGSGHAGDIFGKTGLVSVLKESIPMIVFIGIFLMVIVISYYIRMRIKNYGMFISLGIRRHTFKRMITIEVLGSVGAAVISGGLLGSLLLSALFFLINGSDAEWAITARIWFLSLLVTVLILGLILLIGGLINFHMLENFSIAAAERKEAESEKLPSYIIIIIMLLLGINLAISGFSNFSVPALAESLNIQAEAIIGMMLVFYFGYAYKVRIYHKNKQKNEKNLIKRIAWHFRFQTNARQWILMFGIQTLAFSLFIPQLGSLAAANKQVGLFPYDYVCMSYDADEEFFQGLKQTYHAEIQSVPMIRITTIQGKPFGIVDMFNQTGSKVIWPQGQHVGISEKSYRQWKEQVGQKAKELHLNKDEIYIIHQQDASVSRHPLEYFQGDNIPNFRYGQPLRSYSLGNRIDLYPPHDIVGEEVNAMSGIFHQGYQENIVVMSDTDFEIARREIQDANNESEVINDGPTVLKLLSVPKQSRAAVEKELEAFSENHQKDSSWDETIKPYYAKQEEMEKIENDRRLKQLVYGGLLIMLLSCNLILFYLKFSAEQRERDKQKYFYRCMGMSEAELKRQFQQEFTRLAFRPMIGAIIFSAFFCGIRAFLRMYSRQEMIDYFVWSALLTGGYILIETIVFILFRRQLNSEREQGL